MPGDTQIGGEGAYLRMTYVKGRGRRWGEGRGHEFSNGTERAYFVNGRQPCFMVETNNGTAEAEIDVDRPLNFERLLNEKRTLEGLDTKKANSTIAELGDLIKADLVKDWHWKLTTGTGEGRAQYTLLPPEDEDHSFLNGWLNDKYRVIQAGKRKMAEFETKGPIRSRSFLRF